MDFPVHFRVEPPMGPRKRLSVLFRPILIIPQLLLVGGPVIGCLGVGVYRTGAMGALAWLIAVLDWFAILFNAGPLPGLQSLKRTYLVWRARDLAFGSFLRDEYPPFGEGAYPASLEIGPDPGSHDRLLVFLRPLLILPHFLVLAVLLLAWFLVAIFLWIRVSITGSMPETLWRFSRGVMAYSLRVEAYALLLHDVFPAFRLAPEEEASPR